MGRQHITDGVMCCLGVWVGGRVLWVGGDWGGGTRARCPRPGLPSLRVVEVVGWG